MGLSRLGHAMLGASLVLVFAAAAYGLPVPQVAQAAGLAVQPSADAWLNKQQPDTNYGTAKTLRAASGASETVLRFRTEVWSGQPVASLTLTLNGVGGDATRLSVDHAANKWKEGSVTWRSRPSSIAVLDSSPQPLSTAVKFDVSGLFGSGVVDRNAVTIRVRNASASLVTFGSRESTNAPRLSLQVQVPGVQGTELEPYADTWADSTNPAKTHALNRSLFVDGKPRKEAYVAFDVSAWLNRGYRKLELHMHVGTGGASNISVYRVGTRWSESTLTWNNRPTGGTLLTQVTSGVASGPLTISIGSAFSGKTISSRKLALRVVASSTTGFDFSSREGVTPPILAITPQSPTPSPSATATASPTATPTASPTATPTQRPTATPTACPTPSPTPTPEPLFYFDGRGTDHGVGMSQQGARGRAAAGQTYDQILTFYYTGVELTAIDGSAPIRVLLSDSFRPTATLPARVTAYSGGWHSAAFPGVTFPQGSYVEMWPPTPTPSHSPTATPAPIAALNAMPAVVSPTATPTATACAAPAAQVMAMTAAAAQAPAATPTPMATPTPVPSPTSTTNPTPTPNSSWVATVYDSLGNALARAQTNDLTMEAADPNGVLQMTYRDELPRYRLYRGQMRLLVTPTGLQTINVLPLESYLRGVVPAEVPATWPIEAVKTQAVAARTYAWAKLRADRTWDVLPTAAHQVYGGYQHEHPNGDAAVLATQNIVLTYGGKVISALFHACAGGHTENSEYAFVNDRGEPGTKVPYLRGKPDVDPNGVAYDASAGTFAWKTSQFTMSQLSAMMSRNDFTDVGQIFNITYFRGVSGRVYKVVLEGSKGSKSVSGGKFKNTYNSNRLSGGEMKSTLFYLTPAP